MEDEKEDPVLEKRYAEFQAKVESLQERIEHVFKEYEDLDQAWACEQIVARTIILAMTTTYEALGIIEKTKLNLNSTFDMAEHHHHECDHDHEDGEGEVTT